MVTFCAITTHKGFCSIYVVELSMFIKLKIQCYKLLARTYYQMQ